VAQRRGKHVGRPSALTAEKFDLAVRLLAEGKGRALVARMIGGVGPSTQRGALYARATALAWRFNQPQSYC
jgi:hypothetical protein